MISSTFTQLDWIRLVVTADLYFLIQLVSHSLYTQQSTHIYNNLHDKMAHLAPSLKVSFMDIAEDDLYYYSEINKEYYEDGGEVEDFDDSEAFEYVTQLPTRRTQLVTLVIYCCVYFVAILTALSFGSLQFGNANVMTQKATLCEDHYPLMLGFDETSSSKVALKCQMFCKCIRWSQ